MQKNRIEVAGYLAGKPEVRYLPSGTPVANARLGESYTFKDGKGKAQKHTNPRMLNPRLRMPQLKKRLLRRQETQVRVEPTPLIKTRAISMSSLNP